MRQRLGQVLLLVLAFAAVPATAQTLPDILTYSGADREQKLIEGARKEGQVVLYSAMIVNQALRPLAEKFSKKYPFIKLTTWRADSEDIVLGGGPTGQNIKRPPDFTKIPVDPRTAAQAGTAAAPAVAPGQSPAPKKSTAAPTPTKSTAPPPDAVRRANQAGGPGGIPQP